MSNFKIGDKISKIKGYSFEGTIVSVFKNLNGDERVVAELDGNGMLHIFSPNQLEIRDESSELVLDDLSSLDEKFYTWRLTQKQFKLYLNCSSSYSNDLDGLCIYDGVGDEYKLIIKEGLNFLKDFLKNHKKDLDNFYNLYTLSSYKELLEILNNFKEGYELKYDLKLKIKTKPFYY